MTSSERDTSENEILKNNLNPKEIFPYELDEFQLKAIDSLNQGHSVVVSAPTGSGKTLIGEYAIYRAISHGNKVFYTTPLKALSNQKLRDFRNQFGSRNVGLLTGDLSLNREASILVMTTEIFRNMLYAAADRNDDPLIDMETVVLDECHYMNDAHRGTVWEESIIHCPKSVQFVALSATVANAGQLTDWIEQVHGPTDLVSSDLRPVPLEFNFCSAKGLHPLLNEKGTGLHPNCKIWRPIKSHKKRGRLSKPTQPDSPSLGFVISKLAERNMLPAIYFIFSRRGCDKAVKKIASTCLVNQEERKSIQDRFEKYTILNSEGLRDDLHIKALFNGIASHHAGVLPAWKELIEELFQEGLIKVVFATETLAAGINMPARSTIISTLSKRSDNGHRQLMGSEFLQMAGRAGRRGLDSRGYVVTVQTRFEGVREAGQLATSPADPLISQFTPSYGMVLNLLQRYDLDKSKELIERSFSRYLASLDLVEDEEELFRLKEEFKEYKIFSEDIPWSDFERYEKIKSHLKEERRLLKILQKQSAETLSNELILALEFANNGTLISLKTSRLKGKVTPAVIVEKIQKGERQSQLLCLTDENIWILIACKEVVSLYGELTCLDVSHLTTPEISRSGEIYYGDILSNQIASKISNLAQKNDMRTAQYDLASEVLSQAKLVESLNDELLIHPAHRWGDKKKLKKHRRRMDALGIEIHEREKILYDRSNRHWETFLSLIKVLNHFGCLDDFNPTEIGRGIGSLRGENELWLGLVLMSGHLDELTPVELAGVIQSIATEVNRPDLWSGFIPSVVADEAFNDLSNIRRELFRVQERFGIEVPILWSSELMGLVEAWARGSTWTDLISNTSLDEGDVVRILRRTNDLLSQIPYCESVSRQLRNNAKTAMKLMDRFPVCEAEDINQAKAINHELINPATERHNLD